MRVFVPVDDDWDGRLPTTGEKPVPYRAGLALWHQALAQAGQASGVSPPASEGPVRAGDAGAGQVPLDPTR